MYQAVAEKGTVTGGAGGSIAADLVSAQLQSLRDHGESEKIAHCLEQEFPNLRVSVIKHLETLNELMTSTQKKRANIDVPSR